LPSQPTSPEDLKHLLSESVRGEVYVDPARRGMYATDASHYQVMPKCVVLPKDEHDVAAVVSLARDYGVPITGRGAGTSLAGQTFGPGIVLDFSRHMNRVIEINAEARWARVQPGIVRDHLNEQLAGDGLHFAPDPATSSRATVGGMINNNSSGMRSVKYGMTIDHVIALRVMLASGETIELDTRANAGRAAELRSAVAPIVEAHRDEIAQRYPKVMRRVSGYALDALLDRDPANLAHLIVGSEGTLGLVLEATVRLVPTPKATSLCIVHFDDLIESLRHVPAMLEHEPSAIELLDEIIVSESMTNPSTRDYAGFYVGEPNCVQIVELMADTPEEATRRCGVFAEDMQRRGIGTACVIRSKARDIAEVWELRRLGVGLQSNIGGSTKPLDFIDDACVPVEHLADYVEQLRAVCASHGVRMPICCHASVGVLHPKPMLDLHREEDRIKMQAIADAAFDLVVGYGGAWSGEHGDGLVRGQYIQRFFGDTLYDAFRSIKALFDPDHLMNPGKIVDTPGMTEYLRHGTPGYSLRLAEVTSQFRYDEHGGFGPSVEQCNGVGACRKVGKGTMCPSYMATRNEQDSTRGRANALRLAMTGQLGDAGLTDAGVMDALELCLSCKACKTECPNTVDMSKMKADVLQMHHDRHGTPLKAKLMGGFPDSVRRLPKMLMPLVNSATTQRLAKALMGIDPRRALPRVKNNRAHLRGLSDAAAQQRGGRRVALFVDTYAEAFYHAETQAAVELLDACGFRIELVRPGCCQRPAISKGLIHKAKRDGEKTLRQLLPLSEANVPILFLEPSCMSAITDDLPDLVADIDLGQAVQASCHMMEDFLADELDAGRLPGRFTAQHEDMLIHGHCHQKAIFSTDGLHRILRSIDGLTFSEIDSGCCGMAGSFGYEHHDLSMQIGEQRLFPAVREAASRDAAICANGFSCRHQIKDGCGVEAKHWVEWIAFQRDPRAD
jgi:FAD/FMN-containing dehydrogenase/Fe-S oxidoreductase